MRLLGSIAGVAAAGLLAGCGFTPMYASGTGVAPALSSIEVQAPETRAGYLLREELDDALARRTGQPAAYVLSLAVDEDRYARGLRVDDVATRYEVALRVDYILSDRRTRRQLKTGTVNANVTYDTPDQPYSGIAAFSNGQERAATQAAERIRLDLARWFALAKPTPTDPVPPGVPDMTPGTGG
ncbi:MAG TPA: LPS assembly lipoprotein LptE [Caulobacteraceae bacterium]